MKDIKIELIMIATFFIFIFTLFDFTHCLISYGVVNGQNSLTYHIIAILIPSLFLIGVIIKIIKWNESFGDILFSVYAPLLFWVIIIGIALPLSLIFAGICDGMIMIDSFIRWWEWLAKIQNGFFLQCLCFFHCPFA